MVYTSGLVNLHLPLAICGHVDIILVPHNQHAQVSTPPRNSPRPPSPPAISIPQPLSRTVVASAHSQTYTLVIPDDSFSLSQHTQSTPLSGLIILAPKISHHHFLLFKSTTTLLVQPLLG